MADCVKSINEDMVQSSKTPYAVTDKSCSGSLQETIAQPKLVNPGSKQSILTSSEQEDTLSILQQLKVKKWDPRDYVVYICAIGYDFMPKYIQRLSRNFSGEWFTRGYENITEAVVEYRKIITHFKENEVEIGTKFKVFSFFKNVCHKKNCRLEDGIYWVKHESILRMPVPIGTVDL